MLFMKGKKKLVNELVYQIELADLAEFEDYDVGLSDYYSGMANGLRAALTLINKHAVPRKEIIVRGDRISLQVYDEVEPKPLVLDWN